MTEHEPRTGPARDVPPPRPVVLPPPPDAGVPGASTPGDGAPGDGGGFGRAARVVADAAARLLAATRDAAAARDVAGDREPAPGGGLSAAGVLRDVVTAVASLVRAARPGPGDGGGGAPERAPAAALGDMLAAVAPRLTIRDAERLRRDHPGASDEQIADELVARAARATAGVGAAAGGLSAVQWLAPPTLLALPVQLGAETVLVAAVEVVLVGELHELYGRPAPGDARDRAAAYLTSWSRQRAVDGSPAGVAVVLGTAGMRALRHRVGRRLARNVSAAAPFLLGAALASRVNRRATEALGARLRADLRPGGRATR